MVAISVGLARALVIARDGGCIAPRLDPLAGPCFNEWGALWRAGDRLEADRVRDDPAMGKAPSHEDVQRMVTLCPGHHRGTGPNRGYVWATAHRDDLRRYLDERYPGRR